MTDDRGLHTIADAADALTEPMHTIEITHRIVNGKRVLKRVEIRHASLLDQLAAAVMPGEVYAEDDMAGPVRAPGSTPPAQLEAIHAGMAIDAAVAVWCVRLGLKLRETTTGNIRGLVGVTKTSDDEKQLHADLLHWHGWASTVAGWKRPPWSPPAPCPTCHSRALRVRLDRETAFCLECHESWTSATIDELAAHVNAYLRRSRALAASARLRHRAARVVLA
jgi:hypothetical protein